MSRGFTLIEIMIALVLFAILASITTSAMYHAFDTRERISKQANQLNAIQLAVSLIKQDTEQAISRQSLGNEQHEFAPFVGQTHYVEFTRDGLINPDGLEQRSTLMRVAYLCKNRQFIRRHWERVDTPARDQHQDRVLLDNLDDCAFAYLTHTKKIQTTWGEYDSNQNTATWPIALQVTFTWPAFGNMNALFIIPGALYEH